MQVVEQQPFQGLHKEILPGRDYLHVLLLLLLCSSNLMKFLVKNNQNIKIVFFDARHDAPNQKFRNLLEAEI